MSTQTPGQESVRQALEAMARVPAFRGGSSRARGGAALPPGTLPPGPLPLARSGGGPAPTRPSSAVHDPLMILVQRITQGYDPLDLAHARSIGYDAYLDEQLDPLSIDDSALDARLAGLTTLEMSPKDLVESYGMSTDVPPRELQQATLLRSLYSKRQLFERTCEFWNDHFNVHFRKGNIWALLAKYDREAIRANAFGRLGDLLSATASASAMLVYLDNWVNVAGAPQENYARELLELHTMGAGSGYTENDVHEVAKCFTGWTLDLDHDSDDFLGFRFRSQFHEPGTKYVLGNAIEEAPSAGWSGLRALEVLCSRPETAKHVVGELISWFLTPNPPQALVDQNAQLLLDGSGDIKPVLRSILKRDNMKWAAGIVAPKFRRPFHFMNAVLRTLHADVTDAAPLVDHLERMGHAPFDWPTPAGYPDSVEAWGGSLLPRWTFASDLLAGQVPGVHVAVAPLLTYLEVAAGRHGLGIRINHNLLANSLSGAEVLLVQELIDSFSGPLSWSQVSEAIALAVSMPGFQWY